MQKITETTRRDIADSLLSEAIEWNGRLDETDFLRRMFDLVNMDSTDSRYHNAAADIWKHRLMNEDWDADWIFYDDRFNLMSGDDVTFLQFLCETVHPIVRSDAAEVERLVQLYNNFLKNDGYQLIERTRISGRPVYVGRFVGITQMPGISAIREILGGTDPSYIAQQITRMEAAVNNDPGLAIGTAKELVESCCKTILAEHNVEIPKNADLPHLIKVTVKQLSLTPGDIPEKAKASDTIKRLLSNLATITQGISELRNQYGTGHGKESGAKGLGSRHDACTSANFRELKA